MPRARNIKPGFFKNESLAECEMATRLLFIGLWTLADREGRLEDRPKRIKAELFPYDKVDVDAALSMLDRQGFIIRYAVGDGKYIQIKNFDKHQNPHPKETASNIPAVELNGKVQPSPEQAGLIPSSLIPESLSSDSPAEPVFDTNRNFQEIWNKYPKRDGRKQALAHFRASVRSQADMGRIEHALTNYLSSQRVRDGFVKNGSTWFNNWQDWENYVEDKSPEESKDPLSWTKYLRKNQ